MSDPRPKARLLALSAGALTATAAAVATLPAQLDRELRTPTEHRTFINYPVNSVQSLISQGYRLSDIEVIGANPLLFQGTAVRNQGDYQTDWYWYYGVSFQYLLDRAQQLQARLIDIERYVAGGNVRYAGVLVRNTGPDAVTWYTWTGLSASGLSSALASRNARLVDLDVYDFAGSHRFVAVAIENTGPHQRSSWWYSNVDFAFLDQQVQQNSARVIDIERLDNGRYAAVLVRDGIWPWAWYFGVSAARVLDREDYHKMRVIDIEHYLDGGTPRQVAIYIDNIDQFASYGSACATSAGPLLHDVSSGYGFIDRHTWYRGRNMVGGNPAVMHLGLAPQNLPLDPFAPGCFMLTTADLSFPFNVPQSGEQSVPIFYPDDESLIGVELFTQFAALENQGGNISLATSNGLRTCIRGR